MYTQTGRRRAGPPPPPGPDQPFQLHFSKAMSHAVPSSPEMGLGYLSLSPLSPFLNYAGGKKKIKTQTQQQNQPTPNQNKTKPQPTKNLTKLLGY